MRRQRRQEILVVITCVAVFGLSLGLTIPLVSFNLELRGYDSTAVGIMAAMPALGIIVFSPLMPALIRYLSGRNAILLAIVIDGFSVLALPVFDAYWLWLILRFVMGVAAVLLFVISETWINQIAEERNRGRLIGLYLTALSLCYAGGPAVLALSGSNGFLPFIIASAFYFTAALPVLLTDKAPPEPLGQTRFSVLGFLRIAPTIALGVLLVTIFDGSCAALMPLFGLGHGYSEASAALMITVLIGANTLSQLPLGWLADQMNRYTLMFLCGCVLLISLLLLQPLLYTVWLWFDLMLAGIALGGLYTLAVTLTGARFRGNELVTANAAIGVLWGLGGLVGPPLAGVAMQLDDPDGLVWFWISIVVLFLMIFGYRRLGNPSMSSET